jgi:hypothetical protein
VGNTATAQVVAAVQRKANEFNFPPDGRVDKPRPGEQVFWNLGIGQHALKSQHQAAVKVLAKEIVAAFAKDDTAKVDVEGFASSSGAATSNEPLARRRAESMAGSLITAGVPRDRINTTASGELKARPDETAENMARSRAIRVVLVSRTAGALAKGASQVESLVKVVDDLELDGGQVTYGQDPDKPSQKAILSGTKSKVGMRFSINLIHPSGDFLRPVPFDDLHLVQNVLPFVEWVMKDGSRVRVESAAFLRDKGDPYPATGVGGFRDANDSPSVGVPKRLEADVASVEVRNDFRMWALIVKDGKRTPLRVAPWSFVGQATATSPERGQGELKLDAAVSRVTPTKGVGFPTSEMPVLAPGVNTLSFQIDRGGLKEPTLADDFVKGGRVTSP